MSSNFEKFKSFETTEDCISFVDEGTAQVVRDFIPIESTASKNLLCKNKNFVDTNLPNPFSPILRKMVICETRSFAELKIEIIKSVCFVGFTTAVSVEYSNVEGHNKAKIDYNSENFTRNSLFSEKVVMSIMKSEVFYISCGFETCALINSFGQVLT